MRQTDAEDKALGSPDPEGPLPLDADQLQPPPPAQPRVPIRRYMADGSVRIVWLTVEEVARNFARRGPNAMMDD